MSTDIRSLLQKHVRSVEQRGVENLNADYPFLLAQSEAYPVLCDALLEKIAHIGVDYVAGIEALGFPIAGALAYARRTGFLSIRKDGTLPGEVIQSESFTIPYKNRHTKLEIQQDVPLSDKHVLLFDEAIDTGVSLTHAVRLLQKAGASVPAVLTLTNYPDIREIQGVPVISLIYGQY